MTYEKQRPFVLAIYGTTRGFAFVLFDGPESPFDWGMKEIKEKHKNVKTMEAIGDIVDRYQPDSLVIEDTSTKDCRRSSRIRKLYRMVVHLADSESIDHYRYTKAEVRACFTEAGATTKAEIAKAIAIRIPAFKFRLPRTRKPWMTEDPRQYVFDAAALGITYFRNDGRYLVSPDDQPVDQLLRELEGRT